jgi:hypothetical protein
MMRRKNPDGTNRKRWSYAILRAAAEVAREKGVAIRLNPDGSIDITPRDVEDEGPRQNDSPGLKDW